MNNTNRDLIITAMEVSSLASTPVLLLGNPGWAKSTVCELYAKQIGAHVELLIGSRMDRNEVMGYQVNEGLESLSVKMPKWFSNIKKASEAGKRTILFIDELSTAPGDVQGSLFSLITERKINDDFVLPKDCVIVSAANFAENISSFFKIESPSINRFCIINIDVKNHIDFLDEYFQEESEYTSNWPVFNDVKDFDNLIMKDVLRQSKIDWDEIFQAYSDKEDSSIGCLDLNNHDLSDIYSSCVELAEHGNLYNFISPRTIKILNKNIAACVQLGVDAKSLYVRKMVAGLVGIGTNNFSNAEQVSSYLKIVNKKVTNIISSLSGGQKIEKKEISIFNEDDTITDKCEKMSKFVDSTEFDELTFAKNLVPFVESVEKVYNVKDVHSLMENTLGSKVNEETRKVNYAKFVADFCAIKNIYEQVTCLKLYKKDCEVIIKRLQPIVNSYRFYAEVSV